MIDGADNYNIIEGDSDCISVTAVRINFIANLNFTQKIPYRMLFFSGLC